MTKFLKANPQIEAGLKEQIAPEAAKPAPVVEKLPEAAKPASAELPKEEKPSEAKPERSKVFGTEIKPVTPPPKADAVLDPETKGMTDKAKESWRHIKEERDTARMEADRLRRERDELGKKLNNDAELPKQLETLKAELAAEKLAREEIERELSVAAVDHSKDYKEKVAAPRQLIEQEVEALAKKYEIPAKKLLAAFEEPVESRAEALEEFTAEMREMDKLSVNDLARTNDRIQRTAAELRERAKTSREHMLADRQTEGAQAQQEARTKAQQVAQRVFNDAAKTHGFLSGKTGDEAWDKWVETHRTETLGVDVSDPQKLGEVLARAAQMQPLEKAVDHYKGLYEQTQKDVEALEARLARYEKSAPGLGGRGGDAPAPPEDDSTTPGERIRRSLMTRRP